MRDLPDAELQLLRRTAGRSQVLIRHFLENRVPGERNVAPKSR